MFKFIKAVSDTVLDMINSACYDKPLIFIGVRFWENLVSHHQAVSEAYSCLLKWRLGSKQPINANNITHYAPVS